MEVRFGPVWLIGCLAMIAWHGLTAQECVECHRGVTPGIITDWEASKHGQAAVDCSACHGSGHTSASDVAKATIPTPETCAQCHPRTGNRWQ